MRIREIKNQAKDNLQNHWQQAIIALIIVFAIQQLVGAASAMAVTILALPLTVGYTKFHLNIAHKKDQDYDTLFYGFKNNYGDNFITQLLQHIFIILWTFLLIIPGIVKALAYAMVPYILQDESLNKTGTEAIDLSRKMMDGHKLELLGLYLSFILWYLSFRM